MAGLRVPLSTLRPHRFQCARMARGRADWLGLARATLAFATLHRFSTAHCAFAEPLLAAHATILVWPKWGEPWPNRCTREIWQTRYLQVLVGLTARAGSTPVFGTEAA